MKNIMSPHHLWEKSVGDKAVSHLSCTSSLPRCFAAYT